MIAIIEDFKTGWYGISFELGTEEIDHLISHLQRLKQGEIGHFHFYEDHTVEKNGIADVEFSLKDEHESDNMRILGKI